MSVTRKCRFLEVLLLALLVKEETHGYALYKKILEHTSMEWKPSIGTIYRVLNDMASRKLVVKKIVDRRIVYSITEEGIREFINTSIKPLSRLTGILAILLEAYMEIAREKPCILGEPLIGNLRKLYSVLEKYKDKEII